VKIPSSVSVARRQGFDIRAWSREGLIDGVILGGYLTSAWSASVPEFRAAVGDHVAIYPASDMHADAREKLPLR